jgi:cation:H+ antiporter
VNLVTAGLFVLGLVMLIVGADLLVAGASRVAARLGISSLVIGLTVVAFGTSAPELAVSLTGAIGGQADLALGNVVGSNIFNVLFILGLSALVAPLPVQPQLIRFDVPIMIAATGLCWLLALDGVVGRLDGVLLAVGIVAYTTALILPKRKAPAEPAPTEPPPEPVPNPAPPGWRERLPIQLLQILGGLALLVIGSRWLVDGAISAATAFGVSELVISLTIVAAGTSLPEVATSILATIRGERDIAVGNVVGSCIFNILCVLGLSSAIAPQGVAVAPAALAFDIPVMTLVAVLCLPLFLTGRVIARWEGGVFLAYYLAYTAYLVLVAQSSPLVPGFGWAMRWVIMPATAVLVAGLLYRDVRRRDPLPSARAR